MLANIAGVRNTSIIILAAKISKRKLRVVRADFMPLPRAKRWEERLEGVRLQTAPPDG